MKTAITKTTIIAALTLIITAGTSCKKEDMRLNAQNPSEESQSIANRPTPVPGPGDLASALEVSLKDVTTAGYGTINLSLLGVDVHYKDLPPGQRAWVPLRAKPQSVDVLNYQDKAIFLGESAALPLGNIDAIRLVLGDGNYVIWGDSQGKYKEDLVLSDQDHLADVPFTMQVKAGQKRTVTLLFNATKSIRHYTGGKFIFRPFITIDRADGISGTPEGLPQ